MAKSTTSIKVNSAARKAARTVLRAQKSRRTVNAGSKQAAASHTDAGSGFTQAPVVYVQQGFSDGYIVLGSPIQPKHTSVDLISAAVRALKAR